MNVKSVKYYLRAALSLSSNQRRDARYIFVLIVGLFVLTLTTLQAFNAGWFDSVERPIFHAVNTLPGFFEPIMYALTQFGGFGALFLWAAAAWYLLNRRAAFTVLASGTVAWLFARSLKISVARGRPQDLLESVQLLGAEKFSGFGFPSGHSTFVAACVTVLYFQLPAKYRKYLLLITLLVGISRMYLGAHFPLDVVGGWALGAAIGSAIMLLVGSSSKSISANRIKRALKRAGHEMQFARFANVDARGSRPIFLEDKQGKSYFGKVFGAEEHAADWLFKLYRMARYKNLDAEEPYLDSRRNIEIESFFMLWARKGGVRVPELVDTLKIGADWLLVQERIDAKTMPELKRIQQKSLEDAWKQVNKLHATNIAHRDLRAANIMIDKTGRAWVIDFGFAESSPSKLRKHMDNAELLMSMALLVGPKRSAAAAVKVLGKQAIEGVLPYLQKSVFSGATRSALRGQKDTLSELRNEVGKYIDRDEEDIQSKDIDRLNGKKLFNIMLLALFLYAVIPQFSLFSGTLTAMKDVSLFWFMVIVTGSFLTYLAAGLVFVALSSVPLKIREAALVQLAASFMSKVIPGGIGSSALNVRYLTRAGVDVVTASTLVVAQNAIGFVTFIIPLLVLVVIGGQGLGELVSFKINGVIVVGAVAVLCAVSLLAALHPKLRGWLARKISSTWNSLAELSESPRSVVLAGGASLAISVAYVACLYAATRAFGVDLSIIAIVLVYASAVIAKSAIPTPGGLGPLEVAMAVSLIGFGVDKGEAYAVVILYRLATFWLPVPFSLIAYRYLTKRKIV